MSTIKLKQFKEVFKEISSLMDENKDYLVELDSKAGDGDLGISMSSGFRAVLVSDAMEATTYKKFLMKAGMTINEASPSSLGTIMFIGLVGAAKKIGELEELNVNDLGTFFMSWAQAVMDKTGSKRGEKTILDSVIPAAEYLMETKELMKSAIKEAYRKANEGMLQTIKMQAVHGRAAYYKEKSIGIQDGGATVGMLLIKAFDNYIQTM